MGKVQIERGQVWAEKGVSHRGRRWVRIDMVCDKACLVGDSGPAHVHVTGWDSAGCPTSRSNLPIDRLVTRYRLKNDGRGRNSDIVQHG